MFKDQLKKLRKKNNLTQEELADKLFISRTLVVKWETGKRYPSRDALTKLAEIFGVTYEELIEGNNEPFYAADELSECIPGAESDDNEVNDILTALLSRKISEFLRQLPEQDRKIFVRRYYFYDKTEAIADRFGISPEETRAILHETRAKLMNVIMKENFQ